MQKIKSCLLFLLLLLFFQCNLPTLQESTLENAPLEGEVVSRAASLPAGFKIVGYEPDWAGSAADIRYDKITHLIHAFSNYPDAQGNINGVPNSAKLTDAVARGHAAGVKVILAIGGWNNGNDQTFESLAANPTTRANFIKNCEALVAQYNLDGIDIDWEWPEVGASANNFALLMKELSAALKPKGKLLTAAIIPESDAILGEVINYVDFLNLMVYDGGWSTGAQDHSTYQAAVNAVNYWTRKGAPADKLIIGVPFYARGPAWGTYTPYKNIVARDPDAPNKDESNGAHYNGIPTMKKKTELALQRAGGIMIWELTQDTTDSTSLLNAINEAANSGGPADTEAPTVPTNLTGVGGEGTASLNWTASTDNNAVTGYKIFKDGAYLSSVSTNKADLTGLAEGTYSFTVLAYDRAGNESAQSAAVSVVVKKVNNPVYPTWNKTDVYQANAKVSWKGRNYRAKWYAQGNEPGTSQWGPWEDIGPAGGGDTAAPTVPTNLKALYIAQSAVTLEWTPSTDDVGVSGYNVYRDGVYLQKTGANTVDVINLKADTVYSFTVSAFDAAGNESAQSTAVSVKTKAPVVDNEAPSVPANLAAANITASSVDLSWAAATDNVGVKGYKVYNGTTVVADVAATSVTVSGLAAKTAYTFTVAAYDAAGNESAKSAALSITTLDAGQGGNEWAEGTTYKLGDIVTYKGATYKCTFAHTALSVWTPDAAHALWARQ